MNRHQKLPVAMLIGGLGAVLVIGFAGAQTSPKIGSGDTVADRIRLMRLNNSSLQDMRAKAKADNIEAIAVNAETIAINAMHIPILFPPGSATEKSRAKPEIWTRRAEFEAAAKNLRTQAERLRDAARAKDATTALEIVKNFPRQNCGRCHLPMSDGASFGPIFRTMQ